MKTGIFFGKIEAGLPRRQAEKEAVARILSTEYPGVATGRHPSGLPWLEGAYISIAHSHDIAVVAVSDSPIGIDLEYPRPRLSDIVSRILTPAEQQHYSTPAQHLAAWTSKEAAYKAIHSLQGPHCPHRLITDVTLLPTTPTTSTPSNAQSLPTLAIIGETTFILTHTTLPSTALLTIARPAT